MRGLSAITDAGRSGSLAIVVVPEWIVAERGLALAIKAV